MKHFPTIKERISHYESSFHRSPPSDLRQLMAHLPHLYHRDHPEEPSFSSENRSISEDVRVFLSLYHADGTEFGIYPDATVCIPHELPEEGILHRHGFIEIMYIAEGSFDQLLMGEHLHFTEGEFVITDQNCDHADLLLPQKGAVLFIQIRSSFMNALLHSGETGDDLQRFLFHSLERQKREQSFLEMKEDITRKDSESIREETLYLLEQLFCELHDYSSSTPAAGTRELQRGLLIRLLRHMCTCYSPILHSSSRENKDQALLYELERYIRLHYADVTASSLEEIFHYHRNYYNLLLHKYRGKSFKDYVLDVRMAIAEDLLATTQLPVKEIARRVGYENTSHFYHLYKEKFRRRPRMQGNI